MADIKNQFIVSDEISRERIQELARRTLAYGRVTKEGKIVIDVKTLNI